MNCILDALSSLNVADLSYQEWTIDKVIELAKL